MAQKQPRKISPQAAKILEQYRQAGQKSGAAGSGSGANGADGSGGAEKTNGPAAPGAQMRRSGNRGK